MAVWRGSRLKTFRKNIFQGSQTYGMHAQNGKRHLLLSHKFYIFRPTNVSILWTICVRLHICDFVDSVYELPVLPSKTATEIFLHKSGAVWSVDRIFTIGVPAWRWLGEYVTLDITLVKQEAAAALGISTFFIYHLLRVGRFLKYNYIMRYKTITQINCNNSVINNNYWRFKDLAFFFKIPMGRLKVSFEIYRQFAPPPPPNVRQHWYSLYTGHFFSA